MRSDINFVYQRISNPKIGDCLRASVASILKLELEQVPNFILYDIEWWRIQYYFFLANGYKYSGRVYPNLKETEKTVIIRKPLTYKESINGCFLACVESLNFSTGTHSIIVDKDLNVIHDPTTTIATYSGENLKDDDRLLYVDIFKKMSDDVKACYDYF